MTRLTFLVTLITLIFTGVMVASGVRSQSVKNVNVSIRSKGRVLKDILTELEQRSGFSFVYTEEIGNIPGVIINIDNTSLDDVLRRIAHQKDLVFKISDHLIAVVNAPPAPVLPPVGSVKGRIIEFETSQPLPGASVKIPELNKGVASNDKGYFVITGIPTGKYNLLVTYVGFTTEQVQVDIKEGKELNIDIKLKGSNSLGQVVINGTRKIKGAVAHTNDKQLLEEMRKAESVISGISSEQITRSPDRNAAEVIKRVSGIVLQDDKFIISRGMDPRYSLTYLNDNIAPSTELYSRSFALDLLPSRILDKILVYKSPAPDLMGDMTSGAVKIYTKDAKTLQHLDVELQLGYRQGTTFNDHFLTYSGGKYDLLGFDDGTRKLPSTVPQLGVLQKANISQRDYVTSFSPVLQYGEKKADPNTQLTLNYYNAAKIGNYTLSSLTSFNYKLEDQANDVYRWQGGVNGKVYNETQGTENAQINLLQNFILKLRDSSNVQFKNFLLQQAQNTTVTRIGAPTDGIPSDASFQDIINARGHNFSKDNILSFSQRFLYAGNVGGTHYFDHGKKKFSWNGGYNYSRLDIPDQRAIHLVNNTDDPDYATGTFDLNWHAFVRKGGDGNAIQNFLDYGDISRTWIRSEDMVYNGSADYAWTVKPWITVKAGTFQQWKQKEFSRRVYLVNDGGLTGGYSDISSVPGQNGYVDFNLIGFKEQDLGKVWSDAYLRDDASGLKVYDKTNGSDAYIGTEQNNSGYVAASLLPRGSKIDIYGGLRVEYNRQKVAAAIPPNGISGIGMVNVPVLVDVSKTLFLPSVNVNYRPANNWVLRTAYGKTVNRPEFREVSPYRDIDYVNNQYVTGNPSLRPATIDNIDARIEFYPDNNKAGEILSIGAFYKKLQQPIERIVSTSTVTFTTPQISFENASDGTLKGIEMEARKNLSFLPGKFFRDMGIFANAAFINSKVNKIQTNSVTQGGQTAIVSQTLYQRSLQGQAPYIVNLGLLYDNAGSGTRLSINYNIAGERIYAASPGFVKNNAVDVGSGTGSAYRGSLIELPRHQLDLSFGQRIIKTLQFKFNVQNILNKPVQMAEDDNYTWKYEPYRIIPATFNSNGTIKTVATSEGDHIATGYNPSRYYVISLNYSF